MNSDQDREDWFCLLRRQAAESDKSWTVAFVLSLLLGPFGADRFYLGYGLLGPLKLCTLGGGGVWWLLDIVLLLLGRMKDANGGFVKPPFRGQRAV